MKFLLLIGVLLAALQAAEKTNASGTNKSAADDGSKARTEAQIKKQMEKEKKFAKEQKFYQADEYDFKGVQVDPHSVKKIKAIEPEYDFDMSEGVYGD